MRNSSSNENMEQVSVYLSQIKQVLPSSNLLDRTYQKLNERVSYFWVAAVASVLFVFFGLEFYYTFDRVHATGNELTQVIYTTNNMLYNE